MKGLFKMKKGKALQKAGIKITKELSTLEINKIASIISEKICDSFPEHNINKTDLFSSQFWRAESMTLASAWL